MEHHQSHRRNNNAKRKTKRIASLRDELWDKRLILGVPSEEDQFAQQKNGQLQISANAYHEARGPREKAEYLSDLIDGLAERAVPKAAPKQCPGPGDSRISHLDPPQLVPKMLITPESPLRRLLVVQPPGSGKTCIMIDILSNFLDLPYNIIIVGDPDIFLAIQSNLRKCPAQVGGVSLRERNKGQPAWCVLNSNAKEDILPPEHRLKGCSGEKFRNANIYWLDYVRFGNWLHENDASNKSGGKQARKSSKYRESPFSENTLILMDEVHKLAVPGDEQTTGRWKISALYVGEQLFKAGRDPSTNPIVVGFTATPIIDDPAQAICLATVFKGHTDPAIFKDSAMTQLRIPPKSFYDPAAGFVEAIKSVMITEPGIHGKAPRQVSLHDLQKRLSQNRCMQVAAAAPVQGRGSRKDAAGAGGLKAVALAGHPCPVGDNERAKAVMEVYRLREAAVSPLITLFSNLFFVVNTAADPRKFPEMMSRQRLVSTPPGYEEAIANGAKQGPTAAWSELCNFADPRWLRGYVRRRFSGHPQTPEDTKIIEANAPKWKALAQDLRTKATLAGKTAVYVGARTVEGVCSSSEFLFGLSYYLRDKVGYSDGTKESFARMQHGSAASNDRSASSSSSSERGVPTAPVYVFADKTPDILMPKKHEGQGYRPQDYPLLAGDEEFRKEQLNAFNAAPCTGSEGNSASGYAVILLGYEAYKAIDLECASNMIRLVVQPSGRGEQTAGRARRSCSFRRVSDTSKWMVNLLTYVIADPRCPDFDCDCVLGSFYRAQASLQEQILGIMRGCSIGCTNFREFSQWPNPVRCLLDSRATGAITEKQDQRKLYYCSFNGAPGAPPPPAVIKRGVAGDVSPELVLETAGHFCSTHVESQSIPPPSKSDSSASARSDSSSSSRQRQHASRGKSSSHSSRSSSRRYHTAGSALLPSKQSRSNSHRTPASSRPSHGSSKPVKSLLATPPSKKSSSWRHASYIRSGSAIG